uniref:Uncharacterized protein n=1 Tax=Aedes aegypti TaxID=7159 RepID=A0A6E8P7Q7_AEDAE
MCVLKQIFLTVLLLIVATITSAVNFCDCPCSRAAVLVVQPYFETGAACVRMKSTENYGTLYLGNKMEDGGHLAYVDKYRPPSGTLVSTLRIKHTAYWKLYYPWKNGTGDVPYVIQNILTLEFLVPTRKHRPNQFDRVVVAKPELTAKSLWYFIIGGGGLATKIRNYVLNELLQADEILVGDTKYEGRVFTDTKTPAIKQLLGEGDTPPSSKHGWELRHCEWIL